MQVFRSSAVAAAAILALAGSAVGQPAALAPGVESTTVSQDKVLCVHQDAPTGSHIGSKSVCHTMAQWRTIHDNSEQDMRYLQEHHDLAVEGAALAAGH